MATLVGADTPNPSFVAEDDGSFIFDLTVTDPGALAGTDSVTVQVSNVVPTVDAEPDQIIRLGEEAAIDATFTDPGIADTHIATVDWGDGSQDTVDPATSPLSGDPHLP